MDAVTITAHDQGREGEYHAHVPGAEEIGRLTWVLRGDARVAEHTLVPKAIGGRGVAARLVEAMVDDARAKGFKVKPVCSYVVAAFDRHPDWADVKA